MRDAGHLLIESQLEDASLERAVQLAEELRATIENGRTATAVRSSLTFQEQAVQSTRPEALANGDAPFGHFQTSPVTGTESPFSMEATQVVEDGHAVSRVTLRQGFEGAPGRAHGGVVAAIFDEAMGLVPPMTGHMAFTGWLRVDYKNPCPLHTPLEFRCWHEWTEGRKIMVKSEARSLDDDVVFATAEGLFITPRQDTVADAG